VSGAYGALVKNDCESDRGQVEALATVEPAHLLLEAALTVRLMRPETRLPGPPGTVVARFVKTSLKFTLAFAKVTAGGVTAPRRSPNGLRRRLRLRGWRPRRGPGRRALQETLQPAITIINMGFVGKRSLNLDLTAGQWSFAPSHVGKRSYFTVNT
jgi:hypothetical protein